MSNNNQNIVIRPMQPADIESYLGLVMELATYENMVDQVKATAAAIKRDFFCADPKVEALLAFDGDKAIGYGVFHAVYSTFQGNHGAYIEDIYMQPAYRGSGLGKRLMTEIFRIAQDRGWNYSRFITLNWNEPTLQFNKKLGAIQEPEWILHYLPGDNMAALVDKTTNKAAA
jgi:GNAT superfamily N-acetyltransferase